MKKFRIFCMTIAVCASSAPMTRVWGADIMQAIEATMTKRYEDFHKARAPECAGKSGGTLGECHALLCESRHDQFMIELEPSILKVKDFLVTQQADMDQKKVLLQQNQQLMASYEQKIAAVAAQYEPTVQSQAQVLAAAQTQLNALMEENVLLKQNQANGGGGQNTTPNGSGASGASSASSATGGGSVVPSNGGSNNGGGGGNGRGPKRWY